MLKQLQRKFVLIAMSLVTAMLVVIFGLVITTTKENLERQSMQLLHNVTKEPFDVGFPGDRPNEVMLPHFMVHISYRGTLRVVNDSESFDLSDETLLTTLVDAAQKTQRSSGLLLEYRLRFLWKQDLGGQIYAFVDITSEIVTLENLIRNCVVIGLLTFGLFWFLCTRLAAWAIRPVARAWEQQKQFVADASHELKTPLTVIMTNAELLQDPQTEAATRQQSTASLLVMAQQMRGLVEGLLELARVENGAVQTAFAPVDLSRLVSDGLLPFEPLFFERELGLESQIEPDIQLRGSDFHLEQVLKILLDNALKYSDPGAVSVTLHRSGSHALLTVANPGQPLSPADRENIFKRFYRVDKARSRDGSYGLGLSIAENIVKEHGGKIWVECGEGEIRFRIQLPLRKR